MASRLFVCERSTAQILAQDLPDQLELITENILLSGYQLYVCLDWLVDRSRLLKAYIINTGDPSHTLKGSVLKFKPLQETTSALSPGYSQYGSAGAIKDKVAEAPPNGTNGTRPVTQYDLRLRHMFAQFEHDGLSPKLESEFLVMIATQTSDFFVQQSKGYPSSGSHILIPDGDFDEHIKNVMLSVTLRRCGCIDKLAVGWKTPSPSIVDRFYLTMGIRESSSIPFREAVEKMVMLIQRALYFLGLYDTRASDARYAKSASSNFRSVLFDGFACNDTLAGLEDFYNEFGPFDGFALEEEEDDRLLDPVLLTMLLRTVANHRFQLIELGYLPPKDASGKGWWDLDGFGKMIKHFQRNNGIQPITSVLDAPTRKRLERVWREISEKRDHALRPVTAVSTTVRQITNNIKEMTLNATTTGRQQKELERILLEGGNVDLLRKRGVHIGVDEQNLDFFVSRWNKYPPLSEPRFLKSRVNRSAANTPVGNRSSLSENASSPRYSNRKGQVQESSHRRKQFGSGQRPRFEESSSSNRNEKRRMLNRKEVQTIKPSQIDPSAESVPITAETSNIQVAESSTANVPQTNVADVSDPDISIDTQNISTTLANTSVDDLTWVGKNSPDKEKNDVLEKPLRFASSESNPSSPQHPQPSNTPVRLAAGPARVFKGLKDSTSRTIEGIKEKSRNVGKEVRKFIEKEGRPGFMEGVLSDDENLQYQYEEAIGGPSLMEAQKNKGYDGGVEWGVGGEIVKAPTRRRGPFALRKDSQKSALPHRRTKSLEFDEVFMKDVAAGTFASSNAINLLNTPGRESPDEITRRIGSDKSEKEQNTSKPSDKLSRRPIINVTSDENITQTFDELNDPDDSQQYSEAENAYLYPTIDIKPAIEKIPTDSSAKLPLISDLLNEFEELQKMDGIQDALQSKAGQRVLELLESLTKIVETLSQPDTSIRTPHEFPSYSLKLAQLEDAEKRINSIVDQRMGELDKMKRDITTLISAQKDSLIKVEEIHVATMKAKYGLQVLEGRVAEAEEGSNAFFSRLDDVESKIRSEKR
ncbi:hypothetical protein HDV05_000923 [Chytridiales sp. JEL 0842]|nr:hypothetical protein HDV05_000923 [Chytridiales sp. JEL 0842]